MRSHPVWRALASALLISTMGVSNVLASSAIIIIDEGFHDVPTFVVKTVDDAGREAFTDVVTASPCPTTTQAVVDLFNNGIADPASLTNSSEWVAHDEAGKIAWEFRTPNGKMLVIKFGTFETGPNQFRDRNYLPTTIWAGTYRCISPKKLVVPAPVGVPQTIGLGAIPAGTVVPAGTIVVTRLVIPSARTMLISAGTLPNPTQFGPSPERTTTLDGWIVANLAQAKSDCANQYANDATTSQTPGSWSNGFTVNRAC